MSKRVSTTTKNLSYDRDRDLIAMYNYPKQVQKAIQEIQGISGMIVYDGLISEEEIAFLEEWLETNNYLATKYPLSDLKKLFESITKDGIITKEERDGVFRFLSNIATGTKSNPVIDGIFVKKPRIAFKSKSFLFTGDMEFGPREKAETAVLERGGTLCKSCSLKTNYLVVGNLGSDAYKYGRFGTKIEKALSMQKEKKADIMIIRERDFVEAVVVT